MSLEFVVGGNTAYNENIEAIYYEPIAEWKFQEDLKSSGYNKSLKSLKEAYEKRVNKNIRDKSENGNNTSYWSKQGITFFGKDGTSDAYTKRGMDLEEVEYLDRQLTEKQAWRLETSDTYIDYKVGAKVFIGNTEYIIVFIINQLNIGNIGNFLKARPNPNIVNRWGVKTLILA